MQTTNKRLVIVGNDCAGTELAFAAKASGWTGPIILVSEEREFPYHGSSVLNDYPTGGAIHNSPLPQKPVTYEKNQIDLLMGSYVTYIDREKRFVHLARGEVLTYDVLVFATGARPQTLTAAKTAPLATNIHYLRTAASARGIRNRLKAGAKLVIVGGGYVGLEVAATTAKAGFKVTVLEANKRILERVAAPILSTFYETVHRLAGVDIRTGIQLEAFEVTADRSKITKVICADGGQIEADAVIVATDLVPNCDLAAKAGLSVNNGILVTEDMRTSDVDLYAVGNCACFYSSTYNSFLRIVSIPNAHDQARKIAALICGKPAQPENAPWFWSEQYDMALKMLGISNGYDRIVLRGIPESRSFSAFYLKESRIIAVDTINRAADFTVAKRLVNQRTAIDDQLLADESIPLTTICDKFMHASLAQ